MDYRKILDEILVENRYMCLATSDKNGKPWASPLICISDEKYCFYFISHIHSRHCTNIAENPYVAVSIYHTDQPIGNAFGVQGSGSAEIIDKDSVPVDIRKILYERTAMPILLREYAFYKITMDELYLPDEKRWQHDGAIRTEVKLD